jgi:hypothetical protein
MCLERELIAEAYHLTQSDGNARFVIYSAFNLKLSFVTRQFQYSYRL